MVPLSAAANAASSRTGWACGVCGGVCVPPPPVPGVVVPPPVCCCPPVLLFAAAFFLQRYFLPTFTRLLPAGQRHFFLLSPFLHFGSLAAWASPDDATAL